MKRETWARAIQFAKILQTTQPGSLQAVTSDLYCQPLPEFGLARASIGVIWKPAVRFTATFLVLVENTYLIHWEKEEHECHEE
jgi:hypothetical protein